MSRCSLAVFVVLFLSVISASAQAETRAFAAQNTVQSEALEARPFLYLSGLTVTVDLENPIAAVILRVLEYEPFTAYLKTLVVKACAIVVDYISAWWGIDVKPWDDDDRPLKVNFVRPLSTY